MKPYRLTSRIVVFLTVLFASAAFVHAGNIYVPNFSFESQQTDFADPRIDSWQKPEQPEGFDTNIFGSWDNLAGVFFNDPSTNNPDYISNADGSQLAFLFAYPQMALFQDYNSTDWSNGPPTHAFNATYKAGKAYQLTVGITSSSEEPLTQGSTLLLSLYYRDASSNMVTVGATTVTYDTNVFTNLDQLIDFSVIVTNVQPTDAWAGQNIGIQFMSTVFDPQLIGGVWDLDNVRLTELGAPVLTNPILSSGHFSCTLQSQPNLVFEILGTTNLSAPAAGWTSITTLTNTTGTIQFTDPATNFTQRFYRARRL